MGITSNGFTKISDFFKARNKLSSEIIGEKEKKLIDETMIRKRN